MIVLGLTGGIGQGKSTVNKMFQRLGVPTHDSDFAVHQLYNSPEFAYKVKQAFPYDNVCIMHPSNLYPVVSRKLLGEVVYNDTEKLKKLESIVHPIVEDRQKAFLARCRRAGSTLVVLDVPLLFEAKTNKKCDYTAVVFCPDFLQEVRVLKRPGYTKQRLYDVRKKQIPNKVRIRKGDFLIPTGCSKSETFKTVKNIINNLRFQKGCVYPKQW